MGASRKVTAQLNEAVRSGDGAQFPAELFNELRRIARSHMRGERKGHTLQATALVGEAYMKLAKTGEAQWQSRSHFLATASRAMRQILLDYAKARKREKRGGGEIALSIDEERTPDSVPSPELMELSDALERLEKENPRLAEVVELRYFGGMTVEEIAEALGRSVATIKRDWSVARLWLHRELRNGQE